ncbi:MAG: hypothetical protein AAF544_11500 [Bacteroidota bacterium]
MRILIPTLAILTLVACVREEKGSTGVSVTTSDQGFSQTNEDGDTLGLITRPSGVLMTHNPNYRLTPIYKLKYHKRGDNYYIGSTRFHTNYSSYSRLEENQWNNNFMPGFAAAYGEDMLNLSHYDVEQKREKLFFEELVLIKTVYYPSYSTDTLNSEAVSRGYYMISVYDEDTNEDGYINWKDLRRLYHFDQTEVTGTPLIPKEYAVLSSEYDPGNDFMYVYARKDENENGQSELEEPISVWWIDLKDPQRTGFLYGWGR